MNMAGTTLLAKVQERSNNLTCCSLLIKIYWIAFLLALYHDCVIGIHQVRRDESGTDQSTVQSKHLPRGIVIGFPNCGAGVVIENLKLDTSITHPDETRYKRGIRDIRDVPLNGWDAIKIEREMYYVFNETEAQRIRNINRDAKILVGVCDPVKRAVNAYRHFVTHKVQINENYEQMEDIVVNSKGKIDEHNEWIEQGLYDKFIKVWFKYFPRDNFFFFEKSDFMESPLHTIGKLEKFLGIGSRLAMELKEYTMWKSDQPTLPKLNVRVEVNELLIDAMYDFYRKHNRALFKMINHTYDWEE